MPKLKKTEKQEKDTMLCALVDMHMRLNGIERKSDLGVKLHVAPKTVYNKLNNPEKFTLEELRILFKALGFTEEEKAAVL